MLVNNILQNVQVCQHFLQNVQVYQRFSQVYFTECTEAYSTEWALSKILYTCNTNFREHSQILTLLNMPQVHVYQHLISVLILCIQHSFEMFVIK